MTGLGSTRWVGHRKKTVVEACLAFDVAYLARALHFGEGSARTVTVTWPSAERAGQVPACTVTVTTTAVDGLIRLEYTLPGTGEPVAQVILLTNTKPSFGGLRWWCVCPFCGEWRRILYFAPAGHRFACRLCHRLTYRSCQEAHKYDRGSYAQLARLWGITPQQMRDQMERGRGTGARGGHAFKL